MTKGNPSSTASSLLPLDQILPTVDVAAFFQYEKGSRSVYRNPSHHFILVESGCVEGRIGQEHFEARAGTLICFRPVERNEYRVPVRTRFYQAHITLAPPPQHRCTPFFPGIGLLPGYLPLGRALAEMREQFETFCLLVTNGDAVSRLRVQAAVFNLLRIIASVIKPGRDETVHLDEWERVRWRLVSTESFALKIQELAREMGVSARHFNRVFRQRFNCAPKEYQMRARLNEARHRLSGTDAPIKAIASDLGFANTRSMARMIQRVLGVSPSDLRHRLGESVILPEVPITRPYPVNRHLTSPATPRNWRDQFLTR